MKFEVSRVLFNPAADEYLAVAGYAQCHVFTLGPKGEIADRLCVGPEEWPLDGMHGALLDVDWVPGRTGALSITVSAHVAVFDLAKSSVAPVLTVSLPPRESDRAPARIVASAFAPRGGENRLLVLSEDGALFSHPVGLLTGWVHFLAFDLFVGAWIARDARRIGLSRWIVTPALILTFLFGPVGLLIHLLARKVSGKAGWSLDEPES